MVHFIIGIIYGAFMVAGMITSVVIIVQQFKKK